MRDILKSKVMIGFLLLVVGIIYVDSSVAVRFENKVETEANDMFVINDNLK